MPQETRDAIQWALQQTIKNEFNEEIPVTKDMMQELVDKVREYFNAHNVEYETFSYSDLVQYFEEP